jgi:hypothetical protein
MFDVLCTYNIGECSLGRKPISDEPKTDELVIRLTKSERAELDQAAGDGGTSTWARRIVLRAARAAKKKRAMMPEFRTDGLFSDADILKIPGINTTAKELSEARDAGELHFVKVPKRGPRSYGHQLAAWLEREKGFQP